MFLPTNKLLSVFGIYITCIQQPFSKQTMSKDQKENLGNSPMGIKYIYHDFGRISCENQDRVDVTRQLLQVSR